MMNGLQVAIIIGVVTAALIVGYLVGFIFPPIPPPPIPEFFFPPFDTTSIDDCLDKAREKKNRCVETAFEVWKQMVVERCGPQPPDPTNSQTYQQWLACRDEVSAEFDPNTFCEDIHRAHVNICLERHP